LYRHGGRHFENPEVIDYTENINPMGMPLAVREAAERGVRDAIYYPETSYKTLREAIAKKEKISPDNVVVGNGAAELIFLVCQTIRPLKTLLPVPSFQEYEQGVKGVGGTCIYHELMEADDFQLQSDKLIKQIEKNQDIDLLFLCNPNNPVGDVLPTEHVIQILEVCRKQHIYCVLDECFLEFCQGESMVPFLKNYENLIIIKAFTKLYAMPGLRLGYAMMESRELIGKIQERRQPWNVSLPAQYAGIAALQEETFVKESIQYLQKERKCLIQEMRDRQLCKKIYPSKANYIFFQGEETLQDALYEKGFAIRDCSNYRNLSAGYYRIAVKSHEDNERLLAAWQEIHDQGYE